MVSSLIVLMVLVVIGVAAGLLVNRLWIRSTLVNPSPGGTPACGKCGYPARGISTLNCPECGADLREVGIVTPGQRRGIGAGCLLPVVFSIVVLGVAGVLFPVIERQLPEQSFLHYQLHLEPRSKQFTRGELTIEFSETHPKGTPKAFMNHGMSTSSSWSGNGPRTTTISLSGTKSIPTMQTVRLTVVPMVSTATVWREAGFDVDPTTRHATWTTISGQTHQGHGTFTDQDLLAFLAAAGVDTSRPDVVNEARELYTVMDGLASGMTNFTLTELTSNGSSSSANYSQSPRWFGPSYALTWLVLWIVGLILIARWVRRHRGPEAAHRH